MEHAKTISATEFAKRFKRTGVTRDAIFGSRKALMEEIYATGFPIYCDQSYYSHSSEFNLVVKVGDHFECDRYNKFEDWRDCHYYSECVDAEGNKAWLMTGGRYD